MEISFALERNAVEVRPLPNETHFNRFEMGLSWQANVVDILNEGNCFTNIMMNWWCNIQICPKPPELRFE